MNVRALVSAGRAFIKTNSPSILTGLGVSGVLTTAYLTGRATWKARGRFAEGPPIENMTKKEILAQVWDLYIPPVVSGTVTVTSIVMANHISSKRAAAAYSLLAVSEKVFEEYKEKVVEELGERKEQAIRDSIAQDRVNANPPQTVLVTGQGGVLCCELRTRRYFLCDMETLRKAQNEVNAKIINEHYVAVGEFYWRIGLEFSGDAWYVGWDGGKMMELDFSTVMSPDGKPCLAFEYSYIKPL